MSEHDSAMQDPRQLAIFVTDADRTAAKYIDMKNIQQHMDDFVDQFDILLQRYYPSSWRYKMTDIQRPAI